MVHRGPSKGCLRCKQGHKSCDKTRPSCIRCTRRGLECPGYSDVGGFTFREQDVRKNTNRVSLQRTHSAYPQISISQDITPDPTDFVVTFFVKSVRLTADGRSIALGVSLTPMYNNSPSSSAISMALYTLAGQLTAMALKRPDTSPWHLEQYHRTVSTIIETLAPSDRTNTQEEQKLLAVAILGTTAGLQSARRGNPVFVAHHLGAAALARRLAGTCQSSPLLNVVFATVRRGMLMCAHDSSRSDSDLIADVVSEVDPGDDARNEYPSAHLDILSLRAIRLRRQISKVIEESTSQSSLQGLASCVRLLYDQLQNWGIGIPLDWHPTLQSSGTKSQGRSLESYPTIDVAITYSHWRCTRLLVTRLLLDLSTTMTSSGLFSSAAHLEPVESIVESVLSAAPFLDGEDIDLPPNHPDFAFLQGAMILRKWQYYRVLKHLSFALDLDDDGNVSIMKVDIPQNLCDEIKRRLDGAREWLQSH